MTSPDATDSVTVGVPRETTPGERRVALVPEMVARLTGSGFAVIIEQGAGEGSLFDDAAFESAGATIAPDARSVYSRADIVAKVQPPSPEDATLLRAGTVVISFLDRGRDVASIEAMAKAGTVAFSFNSVPRITRAQSMDAMSAMSTVAGYKAVLLGADSLGRFLPMLMTAAGTVPPAHVFVIGAGVAGLQALATARRLGAVTEAFDTRPAVREQVQSVGATFVEMPVPLEGTETAGGYAAEMEEEFLQRERDAIREPVKRADMVITTALIPGKPAPLLIEEDMVAEMRRGSVIVDLAGEAGGNSSLTVPGETVVKHDVTIMAPLNLPSSLPVHASQLYARNVLTVIEYLVKDGKVALDPEDEIIKGACLTGIEVSA